MKKGDSVRVKIGASDKEIVKYKLAGMQGRIFTKGRYGGKFVYTVEWDSISLKKLPKKYFGVYDNAEGHCLYHHFHYSELELCQPRDFADDVDKAQKNICSKCRECVNEENNDADELFDLLYKVISGEIKINMDDLDEQGIKKLLN